jgi:hypothetical protein
LEVYNNGILNKLGKIEQDAGFSYILYMHSDVRCVVFANYHENTNFIVHINTL